MNILIFIIVLAVLIIVHELGHFLIAKRSGIRVDEFGLGFPPRVWGKKIGDTVYSLNWIPFGGFVKIFGAEDPGQEQISGGDPRQNFQNKNRGIQALVLAGGILFNLAFAWILITLGFMSGMPGSTAFVPREELQDARVIFSHVGKDTPAERAGLRAGDEILYVGASKGASIQGKAPEEMTSFIQGHTDDELTILYRRDGEARSTVLTAEEGVVPGRKAIGILLGEVGVIDLPFHKALYHGFITTGKLVQFVAVTIYDLIVDAFRGKPDFSQITGPVGIVGLVGEARSLGFLSLIFFTALISINLAVVNLIPFPALDGGRLLFVLVEAMKRSPLNPKAVQIANTAGFLILLLLMVVITYRDVVRIFF